MRVAVIQMSSGDNKAANLQKALYLTEEAIKKKAQFVALPEFFGFRSPVVKEYSREESVEKIPGLTTNLFQKIARENNVFILAGTVCEQGHEKGKVYDSAILLDAEGNFALKYRKQHLFSAEIEGKMIREAAVFSPGKLGACAHVLGLKIGIAICYDLRFPGIFQEYAQQGCEVLVVPSMFTRKTGEAHWEILLRARAIETLSYVVAPNQVGGDGDVPAYGNSMIVDPWGNILARASGIKEETIFADIDQQRLDKARRALPDIFPRGRTS